MARHPNRRPANAQRPRSAWQRPTTVLRFVLAAALLAPIAVVDASTRPATAVPNVSTVLDAFIQTCQQDPTLGGPNSPLFYDGRLPLNPNLAIDRTATLQNAWVLPSTNTNVTDPNLQYLCNNHIGSLDQGSVGLLVSVNPEGPVPGDDPTDQNPPPLSEVRLVFSVTNAQINVLPSLCGPGSFIDGSRTSLTCVIPGPLQSQVILVPVTYTAATRVDGTPISMSLVASGIQSQPDDEPVNGPLQNPAPDSDTHQVTIDAVTTPINVSKTGFSYLPLTPVNSRRHAAQRFDDNNDGIWDRVRQAWWINVGPDMLAVGGAGVSPLTFTNFSVTDDPTFGGLYPSARLVSCDQTSIIANAQWVPVTNPTCAQAAAGDPLTITWPNGVYSPLTSSGNTDKIWVAGETPSPLLNRYRDAAYVRVTVEYSAAELLANDQNVDGANVRFCNTAPTAGIVNDGVLADNQSDDQTACSDVDLTPQENIPSVRSAVAYFGGRLDRGPVTTRFLARTGDAGFAAGIYPAWGSVEAQEEDLVFPGQGMYTSFLIENTSTAVGSYEIPANTPTACVRWDPNQQTLTPLKTPESPRGLDDTVLVGGRVDTWFALELAGSSTPALSTFVVEFAVLPSAYSGTNLSPYSCNDGDAPMWVDDPSTLADPAAVNVARLSSTAPIPRGAEVMVSLRTRLNTALVADVDRVTTVVVHRNPDGSWVAPIPNPATTAAIFQVGPGTIPGGLSSFDRAHVSTAEVAVAIDDEGQTAPYFGFPLTTDDTKTSLAGGLDTWDLRPYLRTPNASPSGPRPINNVRLVAVLPPGITYSSSSTPADIYPDCWAFKFNDCITNPSIVNSGYTTLVWNLGTLQSDSVVTTLPPIQLTTRSSAALPGNTQRTIYAYTSQEARPTVNNVNGQFETLIPRNLFRYLSPVAIGNVYDATTILLTNSAALGVGKVSLDPVVQGETSFRHEVSFIQQAGGARDVDLIDVFPYNGDGRATEDGSGSGLPASSQFTGTVELQSVALTSAPAVSTSSIWVSSASPASIERDPFDANAAGQTIGSATWPCTWAHVLASAVGCPARAQVTAIRVFAVDVPDRVSQTFRLTFLPTGNGPLSAYNNAARARGEGLVDLFAQSPVATTTVACLSVGNLVWAEVDDDGRFTAGIDQPMPGVEVVVRRAADDSVAGMATTDGNGRWVVTCLDPGDYYVTIAADQLPPLAVVVAGGVMDGLDEDQGHTALDDLAGGARTAVFTLAFGAAPTGEADPTGLMQSTDPFLRDADTDFTIDLAFDLPRLIVLPVAGSTGNWPYVLFGGALLAMAAAFWWWRSRPRPRHEPSSPDDDAPFPLL